MLPEWNKQRQAVFEDRYALKDKNGNLTEDIPQEMWERIAKVLSKENNDLYDEYYNVLKDFKFVPAGRQLAGIGNQGEATFYNCYVIPFHNKTNNEEGLDSRGAIMDTISSCVEISARGGGVGLNWSVLRPRDSYVAGVNGKSSGTVSWMKAMNGVILQVSQGGSRRGAQMYLLEDWHPDVLEFIKVKEDLEELNGANLSVGISDEFMKAVKNDGDWVLKFPDTSYSKYNEEWDGNIKKWENKGYPIKHYKTIKAREMWDLICRLALKVAEPGVVFLERYNKWSNTRGVERIIGTNPCGEQGLGGWSVCNLGSINLIHFVDEDGEVKWDELKATVRTGVKFLDQIIDENDYIYPQIEEKQSVIRRIGLGTMGLADAMLLAGIKYGSDESLEFIDKVYSFIRDTAYEMSADLAQEKGAAPGFKKERYLNTYFIKQLPEKIRAKIAKYGVRNLSILTQAPTGTTGMLAGVSSGIEPNFNWEYYRQDNLGRRKVYHWLAQEYKNQGKDLPDYFVTAPELSPLEHIRVQARIQQYLDSSISKTVNAPKDHSIEEVKTLYMQGYELGCKGTTYYREGSRSGVLVNDNEEKDKKDKVIEINKEDKLEVEDGFAKCPSCGEYSMGMQEGCNFCLSCGHSKCS
ncbi:adenosylcobalamin-dependent ribonucleoside-diphosphate reductase [Orenia marismortui]|uniref:adenosylcobalamin-dependent ribonucleoside-diphosphate reductase n=1 Tax=Orenia marismortui TaxID=46469 RepID=UPI00037F4A8D|nr:adenosylcobalamin-dependent ribonucleoside-diphosphate reductase [Orenia marismortui]